MPDKHEKNITILVANGPSPPSPTRTSSWIAASLTSSAPTGPASPPLLAGKFETFASDQSPREVEEEKNSNFPPQGGWSRWSSIIHRVPTAAREVSTVNSGSRRWERTREDRTKIREEEPRKEKKKLENSAGGESSKRIKRYDVY